MIDWFAVSRFSVSVVNLFWSPELFTQKQALYLLAHICHQDRRTIVACVLPSVLLCIYQSNVCFWAGFLEVFVFRLGDGYACFTSFADFLECNLFLLYFFEYNYSNTFEFAILLLGLALHWLKLLVITCAVTKFDILIDVFPLADLIGGDVSENQLKIASSLVSTAQLNFRCPCPFYRLLVIFLARVSLVLWNLRQLPLRPASVDVSFQIYC